MVTKVFRSRSRSINVQTRGSRIGPRSLQYIVYKSKSVRTLKEKLVSPDPLQKLLPFSPNNPRSLLHRFTSSYPSHLCSAHIFFLSCFKAVSSLVSSGILNSWLKSKMQIKTVLNFQFFFKCQSCSPFFPISPCFSAISFIIRYDCFLHDLSPSNSPISTLVILFSVIWLICIHVYIQKSRCLLVP